MRVSMRFGCAARHRHMRRLMLGNKRCLGHISFIHFSQIRSVCVSLIPHSIFRNDRKWLCVTASEHNIFHFAAQGNAYCMTLSYSRDSTAIFVFHFSFSCRRQLYNVGRADGYTHCIFS